MGKIKKRTFKNQRNEFENDSFIRKETKPRVTKPTGKLFYFFFKIYHFRNFFLFFWQDFFEKLSKIIEFIILICSKHFF